MNRYRVEWKSKVSDHQGQGAWLHSKDAAEATASMMNKEFPNINHWVSSEFPEGPQPLRLTFAIDHPGESAAGISPYTDTVTVEVESGDPCGEEGEFAEFILTALREWYDGARVTKT